MTMVLLAVTGLLPFLLGWLMNVCMMAFSNAVLPFPVVALVALFFLAIWFVISYLAFQHIKSFKKVVLLLNLAALAVLLLLGVQELFLRAYWSNSLGVWTQLFYLPLLSLGYLLTSWSRTVFPAYCMAFLLMMAASFAGCMAGKRKN